MLELTKFSTAIEGAYEELAPHRICSVYMTLQMHLINSTMKQKFFQRKMLPGNHHGFSFYFSLRMFWSAVWIYWALVRRKECNYEEKTAF